MSYEQFNEWITEPLRRARVAALEIHTKRELNCALDGSNRQGVDYAPVLCVDARNWVREIDFVEYIERIRAKLHSHPLGNAYVLGD